MPIPRRLPLRNWHELSWAAAPCRLQAGTKRSGIKNTIANLQNEPVTTAAAPSPKFHYTHFEIYTEWRRCMKN